MARIPDDELERLKREVPLADLCRRRGVELKGQGENLVASCPFHDDREPSFVVTPAKNLWHCFGACNKGGDVIAFITEYEKVSFRHAVDILRRESGMGGEGPAAPMLTTIRGTQHPVLIEPGSELSDAALLAHVADYYHRTLKNTSKGMEYLQERGVLSPEAVNTFKLGFSNRTVGYRVPASTQEGQKLKAQLQKIGILRDSGHEHFSGCIVFPIYNAAGEVVEMYGRRTVYPSRDMPKHLYLPGPHAGVWNAGGVAGQDEWLLCEALIDALSLWVIGFKNVTASYGVNGFTLDHWKLLRQHKPRRILLCQDADEAGNKAANELAQQLEPEGIEAWRVEFKPHTDINDLVRGIQGVRSKDEDPRTLFTSLLAAARRLLPTERPVVVPVPAMIPAPTVKPPELSSAAPTPASASALTLPASADAPVFEILHDGKQAELKIGGGGGRGYRVRGLENNSTFDQLKINLRVVYGQGNLERFHVDTLDLYNARQRAAFIAAGHQVLGLPRATMETDLTQLLMKLEAHQEAQILAKAKVHEPVDAGPKMTPEEESKALTLLREPKLFARLLADFELAGVVGDENKKMLGYLIAVSRKLSKPLSGQITARSAAGKSSLMNAILDFVPAEDKQVVTAMTGQALYYLPEDGLAHKVLAIVEDEGSQQASYPLKILQSENELILAVTVKDPDGGMPQTQLKRVKGPVAQFTTSTRPETDYELENRYLILSVDEGRSQTQRIHQAQRQEETLRGLLRDLDRQEVLNTHHNAQRLLRPLRVNNPFADQLTFPDHQLRHCAVIIKKYLGLIRTTAFLRQYQKPIKSCQHRGQDLQYIEVDIEDVRLVHELAVQTLGRSLDELSPPTRSFLLALHGMVEALAKEQHGGGIRVDAVRFSRRAIRERIGWSVTQVREHLEKLLELEYVVCHRVPGPANRWEYELAWDGQGTDGGAFINGLASLAILVGGGGGGGVPSTMGIDGQNQAIVG